MDKALQKVAEFNNRYATQWIQVELERIQQMPGVSRLFRRIASVPSKEQLDDYLAEVRYALIFAGVEFQVEIEPFGSEGPDLRVSRDGQSAVVEVKRFRKVYPGPPVLDWKTTTCCCQSMEIRHGIDERQPRKYRPHFLR